MIAVTLTSVALVSIALRILSATVRSCFEVVLIAKILFSNTSGAAGGWGAAGAGVWGWVIDIGSESQHGLVFESHEDDEADQANKKHTCGGNSGDLGELFPGGGARELEDPEVLAE